RDIAFEPDVFLAEAATTFALMAALRRQPDDVALTGGVRRDYEAAPGFDLWMLGATTWRTEAGARGLTLHGFVPEDRRWRSVSIAGGGGVVPAFARRAAYESRGGAGGAAGARGGRVLRPAAPPAAGAGATAPPLAGPAAVASGIRNLNALIDAGA